MKEWVKGVPGKGVPGRRISLHRLSKAGNVPRGGRGKAEWLGSWTGMSKSECSRS